MASSDAKSRVAALERVLGDIGRVAVAVSGGVDSMTLAVVAHRALGDASTMVHAVSAAVPADATGRVERYARREGWRLERIDAGELLDARYVANPVNRCYFCKTSLYSTIAPARRRRGDHRLRHQHRRPRGLPAGARGRVRARCPPPLRRVRHRQVLGAGDGGRARAPRPRRAPRRAVPVEPGRDRHRHRSAGVEGRRCVRTGSCAARRGRSRCAAECAATRWVVELDDAALSELDASRRAGLRGEVERRMSAAGVSRTLRFEPYRMGSAFLRSSDSV